MGNINDVRTEIETGTEKIKNDMHSAIMRVSETRRRIREPAMAEIPSNVLPSYPTTLRLTQLC